MARNVLLLGESWLTAETHFKGFDRFNSASFHTGAQPFLRAVEGEAFRVTYMPSHVAVVEMPYDRAGLDRYDAVVLSDIGANSLLLPPDVFVRSQPRPNRLKLLRDWVRDGGGLMMVGGYLSFQGIDGKARWRRTPVEEVLPVTCLPYDDRLEVPEGFVARLTGPAGHPLTEGLGGAWPPILGANEIVPKEGCEVLARLPEEEGGHALLVCGAFGRGRSIAWASDMGPHWLPQAFMEWEGFARLWLNCLRWLTRAG